MALGLAACGRKGPLDPPPGAAPPQLQATGEQLPIATSPQFPMGTPTGVAATTPQQRLPRGRAVIAPGPSGTQPDFPLDFLID